MIKENKIINFLPYLGLVMVIVLPWFLRSGYLFFTDMVWGPNMDLPSWTSGWIYLSLIVKGLNFIIPVSLIEKLFIAFTFGIILFGGYKIAESFIPLEKSSLTEQAQNKIILFLGSAFALFNPFVYDRVMYGQFGIILSYGFFLASFGYLISYYFTSEKRKIFLGSVFAGLAVLFAAHFIFFVGLVYFILGILILLKNRSSKENLLKFAKYFVLSFLIIIAINFNWLYGTFFEKGELKEFVETKITKQDLQAFKTRGDTPFEVAENVLLMSGFWGIEQFRYEPLQSIKENWGRSFYFLLPIIIWGLAVNFKEKEKRKLNIGLIFIFAVSFVLALGIALPITSKITLWLFNNVPFYKGLREPQKWVAALVAVYEVLLVCGLIELFKKRIIIKHKESTVILLTFVIILQTPLLVWGGAGQAGPVDYPRNWYEVNDLIVKESGCQSKILFLPWHLYMSFKWIGNIVASPAPKFFECPVIYGKNMEFGGIYSKSSERQQREVQEWLSSFGHTDLLVKNDLNIGYIVLAKEVDWRNYLWIESHPMVRMVKETEDLKVFRVKSNGE